MKRAIITSILLAFVLAGCGSSRTSSGVTVAPQGQTKASPDSSDFQRARWTELNNGVFILRVQMSVNSGQDLVCVEDSYENSTNSLSVSCNWEDYNARVRGIGPTNP